MKLILVDPSHDVCVAWRRHFPSDVDVRHDLFENVTDADAFATAGNSFGIMDGGVDRAVAKYDTTVEEAVQQSIRRNYHGELSVGSSIIVPMRSDSYDWLIYAPTMRIPMSIVGTDNVYQATWAALCAATGLAVDVGVIDTLAMPGFGTTTGRVPAGEAARQMAVAWRNFGHVPAKQTWQQASRRHQEIRGKA